MADTTFKMTKLVGESSESIEAAVRHALGTSASKVHGQSWAHITDLRVGLNADGSIQAWQVALEVAFKVDE
jgi:flavin-binding protein dodecin